MYKSGAFYNGEWKKGSKDGHGKFNYPDGSVYCGAFKSNKRHGFGKYTYPNGDVFEGAWRENVKHGVGSYIYQETRISFKGTWINDVLKGPVEVETSYPNFHYHGYYNKSHPIGDGAFTFDMKYMLPGHIELFESTDMSSRDDESPSQPLTNEFDEDENSHSTNEKIPQCIPQFIAHGIVPYDYSRLPQHPIPPPEADSSATSICTNSSQSGEDEVHLYQMSSPKLVSLQYCETEAEDEFNCLDESDGA